jgi:hypothetical protein
MGFVNDLVVHEAFRSNDSKAQDRVRDREFFLVRLWGDAAGAI